MRYSIARTSRTKQLNICNFSFGESCSLPLLTDNENEIKVSLSKLMTQAFAFNVLSIGQAAAVGSWELLRHSDRFFGAPL